MKNYKFLHFFSILFYLLLFIYENDKSFLFQNFINWNVLLLQKYKLFNIKKTFIIKNKKMNMILYNKNG